MTITPKPQNKKKNFEETFWFSLNTCFFGFPCVLLFCFGFDSQKPNKNLLFFLFVWRSMVGENHQKPKKKFFAFQNQTKNKKTQGKNKKKHLLRLNQKVSSKFWFFGFSFWGFGVIVILYILQAFRYTKMTNRVYIIYVCVSYIYICMCVLKDMIQEALRWVPHIYIHIYTYYK